jgi:hypothetical protein
MRTSKYRAAMEQAVCHIWETAAIELYLTIDPISELIGMRTLHNFTRGIDDDYWFMVDVVEQAMARVYHSTEDDPWSKFR